MTASLLAVARVHNFLRHQRSVLAVTPASSPKAICEAWCTEKFIRTARRTVRRGPIYIWAIGRMEAVEQHRVFKPSGSEIDVGYRGGHVDATDEVARPLSDIEALPACLSCVCFQLAAAGLEMAEKASEPF